MQVEVSFLSLFLSL